MSSGSMGGLAWLGCLGALWFLLFRQVCGYWTIEPQYNFGWFVPLLGGYVAWARWQSRPEPSSGTPKALIFAGLLVVLALLGLVRVVQEANRDWQLVSWSMALLTVLATWLGLIWMGGWAWWRHFLFATLFPLVAVPWPSTLEQPFILGLTQTVAGIAAELLTWAGMPAIQRGNIIELSAGPVGVEEACSGIQSFQSSVMMSLFLGEVFAFFGAQRIALFLWSIGWSFLCNLCRTLYLGRAMYLAGRDEVARLHDPAGYAAMAAGYAGIIAIALWFARGMPIPKPVEPTGRTRIVPVAWCLATLAWLAAVEAGTQFWYSRHEAAKAAAAGTLDWSLRLGANLAGAKPVDPPSNVRLILRYNEASMFEWISPEGNAWAFNALRWEPGNLAADNAGYHNPAVCLVTSGFLLKEEYPQRTFRIGGAEVPFRMYRFENNGQQIFSFYCLWDQREGFQDNRMPEAGGWTSGARIRNVLAGKRTAGLQVVNVSVRGPAKQEQAVQQFEEILSKASLAKAQ